MNKYEALNPSFAKEVNESFARQSMMSLIDAQLTRVEPGRVDITLPFRGDLTQQHGYIHAGIITTIADSACGYAAYSLMPPESDVLSIEFKINLLRPGKGETFVARAEVIRPGKTVSVARADVFAVTRQHELLIATMQATMMRLTK
jgi:uncharacterized protein (TIGR00369 family)